MEFPFLATGDVDLVDASHDVAQDKHLADDRDHGEEELAHDVGPGLVLDEVAGKASDKELLDAILGAGSERCPPAGCLRIG